MGPTKRPRDEVGDAAADASASAASSAVAAARRSGRGPRPRRRAVGERGGVARRHRTDPRASRRARRPGQLHEVELKRLREVNCRLYCARIAYDPPDGVCQTHAPRLAVLHDAARDAADLCRRGRRWGTLAERGVEVLERRSTLSTRMCTSASPTLAPIRGIKHPPAGVAFPKRQERLRDEITRLSSRRWRVGRERSGARSRRARRGAPRRHGGARAAIANPRVSRFVPKPTVVSNHDDPIAELASKQPRWLNHSLVVIGMTFHAARSAARLARSRARASYTKLANAIEERTSGSRARAAWDVPRRACTPTPTGASWGVATRWAQDVRLAVATQIASNPRCPLPARAPSVAELFRQVEGQQHGGLQERARRGWACRRNVEDLGGAGDGLWRALSDNAMLAWERRMLRPAGPRAGCRGTWLTLRSSRGRGVVPPARARNARSRRAGRRARTGARPIAASSVLARGGGDGERCPGSSTSSFGLWAGDGGCHGTLIAEHRRRRARRSTR